MSYWKKVKEKYDAQLGQNQEKFKQIYRYVRSKKNHFRFNDTDVPVTLIDKKRAHKGLSKSEWMLNQYGASLSYCIKDLLSKHHECPLPKLNEIQTANNEIKTIFNYYDRLMHLNKKIEVDEKEDPGSMFAYEFDDDCKKNWQKQWNDALSLRAQSLKKKSDLSAIKLSISSQRQQLKKQHPHIFRFKTEKEKQDDKGGEDVYDGFLDVNGTEV